MKSGLSTFCQLQLCSLAKPIKFYFPMNFTRVQHALQYFYYTIKRFCVDYSRGSPNSHSRLKFWVCKTPSRCEALKGCVWNLWPLFSFCRVGLRIGMGAGGLWKASYHHTHPIIPPSPKGKPETVLLKCDAFAVKFWCDLKVIGSSCGPWALCLNLMCLNQLRHTSKCPNLPYFLNYKTHLTVRRT